MDELKKKLVEMLAYFDSVCRENNLKYYAVGGTMLGAVRHKGFIPWDDDIDVGMPRADYDKLIQLSIGDKYKIETINDNKKDFVYPYAKLYDTTTTLIENTRYKTKRGIYIDVFPLDGIGSTLDESKKNFSTINKKINLLSTRVCAINKKRKAYKNLSIILSRLIPEFVINHTKLIKKIDLIAQKYDFDETKYVANLVGNWGIKEIMPREFFGNPKEYEFENIKIYGVENYDEYLSSLYGKYMQFPPVEKQVSHHDYIKCDLNKSYLLED